MPSPVAHASLILLSSPLLARARFEPSPRQRWGLLGVTLFALLAPDLDFFLLAFFPKGGLIDHGTFTHSLVAGPVFALGFGLATGAWLRLPWRWMALVGLACHWSHCLLDAATRGRGVMLLWPFTQERIGTPFPLFYGAQWHDLFAFKQHAITLATELGFAALVAALAWWLRPPATTAAS
ncbi:MAG: metal-dependent hydrolase [Acidobacteriota bacterium]